MKKVLIYTIFIFFLVTYCCLFNVSNVYATEQGDVVINELMWMGSSLSSKDEWIELRNMTEFDIDISGWQITKKSSGQEKLMLEIPAGKMIKANDYFLISHFSQDVSKLNITPDLVDKNVSLVNSDLQVRLYDGDFQDIATELIDEADDGQGTPLAGDNIKKYSSERNQEPDDGTLASSWHTSRKSVNFDPGSIERGTPGAENSKSIEYSDKVVISEILPNPQGEETEEEFIELRNGDTVEVDLEEWILKDASGNDYAISKDDFPEGTIVAPGDFFVIYRKQSGIALNNNGEEEVKLINPDDQEVDSVIYNNPSGKNSVPEDWSYNRIGDNFSWSTTLTPGEENIITEEQITETPLPTAVVFNIAGARDLPKGSQVIVEGIVTVAPGVLGSQIFYIQDSGSGIQIYCYKSNFPILKIGDRIKVTGEISESGGEKRIKIGGAGDVQILGNINPPSSINLKTGSVGERYEGRLVAVSGRVVRSSGSIFYINDGSGEVKIYIRSSTGIKKPKLKKGDWVYITGIVSQTKSGYRILPRYQNDIKVLGKYSKTSGVKSEEDKGEVKGISKAYAASPSDYHFSQPHSPPTEIKTAKDWLFVLGWIVIILGLWGLVGMKIMIVRKENVQDYF